MSAVWDTFVNNVQGNYAKPVELQGCAAQRYDMGRAVGTFAEEAEDAEDATCEQQTATVAETVRTAKTTRERKNSKAEVVRGMIRSAKAEGRDKDSVIAQIIEVLGFKKQLAKSYANWYWELV